MPNIRPISDLRDCSNEISEFCNAYNEPVFITKDGIGDMVVISAEMYEMYELQQARLELYTKLAEADASEAAGIPNVNFAEAAAKIREKLVKKLNGEI
jgi:PHD/YefM family antitoxin component YafN of YafNO toxin-antitoxin module